ncbi:MAG: hypothetical protein LBT51_01735, partial [Fusobacteriaceae bacterium]|nr:hypothetical protein [Fusobacteriaceae bacterium]
MEGTVNVNSKFDVDGNYKVEAVEKVIHSGANVIADTVDIKGKEVIVESVQDTEKSKGSTSGASLSLSPTLVPTGGGFNYTNSNGKKKWVSDQTSIIAKNGGTIEAENFTDIGAIIGSESEDNKLLVIADTVTVENLEDKDKSTVHGGGISVSGSKIPNTSIVDGLQD